MKRMLYSNIRANAKALRQECNLLPCLRSSKEANFIEVEKARAKLVYIEVGNSSCWKDFEITKELQGCCGDFKFYAVKWETHWGV